MIFLVTVNFVSPHLILFVLIGRYSLLLGSHGLFFA